MHIAIILTGQLRTVELTKYFHKKMFGNNVDYYLSIDTDNETQLLYQNNINNSSSDKINEIINFYNPKKYYVGTDADKNIIYDDYKNLINNKIFFEDKNTAEEQEMINKILIKNNIFQKLYHEKNKNKNCVQLSETALKGIFRQYYFVNKGYELLNEYSEENNISYDLVMRLRFDMIFIDDTIEQMNFIKEKNQIKYCDENIELIRSSTIPILKLDNCLTNTIDIIGYGVYENYIYVNDFYWTHGNDLIKIMSKYYSEMNNIIKKCAETMFPIYGASIEHYLACFLFNNNVNLSLTKLNRLNIIREY